MPNRTELTDKLQRVQGMVSYVRDNLSLEEYDLFLDMVAPLPAPEPEPATKKPQKKSAKKAASKSSRASGMAAQLRESRQRHGPTVSGFADDTDLQRCTFLRDDGKPCGLLADHNVHHMKSAMGYHSFQSSEDAPGAVGALSSSPPTTAKDDSYAVNSEGASA